MQLGIDAGATRTKWSLAEGGKIVARGESCALTGHVFTTEQRQDALDRLENLAARFRDGRPGVTVTRVVAGVTGVEQGEGAALTLRALIARVLSLPAEAVTVQSDLRLAFLAHHPPGQGVLLYVGTGSIAYHLDARGQAFRAGGYGHLLGDEGGALWLARQAMRQLLRQRDEGVPPTSVLARKFAHALGDLDWPTLRAFTYGGERDAFAALAPLVSEAAAEGDPTAQALLQEGARELVRLVHCVLQHAPQATSITASGGAFTDALLELVRAELPTALSLKRSAVHVSDANARHSPDP